MSCVIRIYNVYTHLFDTKPQRERFCGFQVIYSSRRNFFTYRNFTFWLQHNTSHKLFVFHEWFSNLVKSDVDVETLRARNSVGWVIRVSSRWKLLPWPPTSLNRWKAKSSPVVGDFAAFWSKGLKPSHEVSTWNSCGEQSHDRSDMVHSEGPCVTVHYIKNIDVGSMYASFGDVEWCTIN